MFDTEAFAAMRPGTLLVNTARAGLIDEAALVCALERGVVAGAALDLFSPEAPTGPLGRDPRVILTPHLGGSTEEALARTARAAAENVITSLNGTQPDSALSLKEYHA
jgi:D-3-phosphoglycerate dehydrogenase